MKPVVPTAMLPGAQMIVFAQDQPQYDPLPAAVNSDGLVMTEWELSAEELARILAGGRVRLWVWTFRRALQPVMLEVVE